MLGEKYDIMIESIKKILSREESKEECYTIGMKYANKYNDMTKLLFSDKIIDIDLLNTLKMQIVTDHSYVKAMSKFNFFSLKAKENLIMMDHIMDFINSIFIS
jgi:hypothetical protein